MQTSPTGPFASEAELEAALATPTAELVADFARSRGDLVILGAGGKMGPTLAVLARRALDAAGRKGDRVYAVSRFGAGDLQARLRADGIVVVPFDLVMADDLGELPDAPHVVFMVGAKFGSATNPAWSWEVNAALPDRVGRRYPHSSIAVLSTGNVYPFVPVSSGGAVEETPPSPIGEYAQSCLARERVFEFSAQQRGTSVTLIRLNYAVDLRYGVLADVGAAILAGEPISQAMGHVNVVWQGYANEVVLRSLGHATPDVFRLNVTGPEVLAVADVATRMAGLLGRPVTLVDDPQPTALLSNASLCMRLFGHPPLDAATLVEWQSDWLRRGLPLIGKPTKWATRDGKF